MRASTTLLLVASLARPAFAAPPTVERWGALREVLREGRTEGRVALRELGGAGAVGLGALEGLAGEVVIVDGEVWVTRADGESGAATTKAGGDELATFAVVSRVADWTEHRLERDLDLDGLEAELRRLGVEQGLGDAVSLPFIVDGRFRDLEGHVLNGACPFASDGPPPDELAPRPVERSRSRGRLVGFWSAEPPGVLTHHGSRTHVHALLGRGRPAGGHVDAVTIRAGSTLRLPEPARDRD